MSDWNIYFKRIKASLNLTSRDVVSICTNGALEITESHAEAWARGRHDERRSVAMKQNEFDAFTNGLILWGRTNLKR